MACLPIHPDVGDPKLLRWLNIVGSAVRNVKPSTSLYPHALLRGDKNPVGWFVGSNLFRSYNYIKLNFEQASCCPENIVVNSGKNALLDV